MQTLKELIKKVHTEFLASDWSKEYSDLTDIHVLSDSLEAIALDTIADFIPKNKLNDFIEASEKSYTEETFKKFIPNYWEFLDEVENQFYQSLLVGLAE